MPRFVIVILGLLAVTVVLFVAVEALSPTNAPLPPVPEEPSDEPEPPGEPVGIEPAPIPEPDGGTPATEAPSGVGNVFGMVRREDDRVAVPNASVTLWRGRWRRTVKTDDSGGYRVEGVPAGQVRLRAQSKDLVVSPVKRVTVEDGLDERIDFDLATGTILAGRVTDRNSGAGIKGATVRIRGRSQKVTKTDEAGLYRLSGLGAGTLILEAEADRYPVARQPVSVAADSKSITQDIGLVLGGTIEGVVLDEAGTPIEGVKVLIRQARDRPALSGSDGKFTLSAVPANVSVRLEAEKKGFVPTRSEPLELRSSETARDIVVRLSRGGSVSGKVTLADGSPAVGATVRLMPMSPGGRVVRIPSAKTDEQGEFLLSPVSPGDHRATAVLRGALSATTEVRGVSEGGEVAGVEIRLGSALGISGVVTNFDGKPVAKVFVTARPVQVRSGARFGSARTDGEGAFEIVGLVEGNYRVSVRPPRGGPEAASMEVAAGTTEVKLTVPAPGTVSGRAILAGGEPVSSYAVRLSPVEGGGTTYRRVTDGAGRFELTDLTPGTYRISASSGTGFSRPVPPITVPSGGEVGGLELVLEAGGRIVGRVLDGGGQPLEGCSVRARGAGDGLRATRGGSRTGATGEFTIQRVQPGTYLVTASKGGLLATADGVEVASGADVRVDLRMPPSGGLTVRVRDDRGWPVEGAYVQVRGDNGRWIAPVPVPVSNSLPPAERVAAERDARRRAQVTDSNGLSARTGVPAGKVSVRVLARGYADQETSVAIPAGKTADVGVTLKPGTSSMSGRKVDPGRRR